MAKKRYGGFRNTNRLKRVNELTGGYKKQLHNLTTALPSDFRHKEHINIVRLLVLGCCPCRGIRFRKCLVGA
jgi:hypothetical protein